MSGGPPAAALGRAAAGARRASGRAAAALGRRASSRSAFALGHADVRSASGRTTAARPLPTARAFVPGGSFNGAHLWTYLCLNR